MSSVEDMLAQIAREWDKAERLIKSAERVRAQVVIASVNELRYAGRRLVDAQHLSERAKTDPAAKEEFDRYISDALLFTARAQHDAVDAIVLFLQKAVEKYENEFGLSLLAEKYPRIFDIKAAIALADTLIIASRSDREKRSIEYDRLADEHCPTLLEHYQHLVANEAILLELVRAKESVARESKSQYKILIAVTILAGLGGGLVGAVSTVALEHKPPSCQAKPTAPIENPTSNCPTPPQPISGKPSDPAKKLPAPTPSHS